MTNSPKNNISSRTSEKKHGALYKDGVKHVESQDDLASTDAQTNSKTSEEE